MDHDVFDGILEQWESRMPDADTSGFEVAGRILLLAKHLQTSLSERLGALGLDMWAFEVLSALWRQGPPYHLSPTELCRAAMLSSSAMTNRLDRLEQSGFVARKPDPGDRRSLVIELTPEGNAIINEAVRVRLDEANASIGPLTGPEKSELVHLLRKLLSDREADV
jgi:DNA-binding MarR family transcriptional regulator